MSASNGEPPTSNFQHPTSSLPRRDFLALAGRGALWTTLGASIVALARFLGFVEPEPALTFALDTPDAYPVDTLTPVADGRAFVGRDARGLYAIVAVCTHLGCLARNRDRGFECPCHGSRFDASGAVSQGPADRSLARARLSLDANGRLSLHLREIVDDAFRLVLSG
jgi:nitrite reductase/ring-hydroxylating ferredoxin subunit